MTELNDAGTYYNAGPRKVTGTGTYHYMCSRNNNFSNRSQKGKIIVTPAVGTLKYRLILSLFSTNISDVIVAC